MKKTPFAIALGAMFMSGAAFAFAVEDFVAADANADGQVTLEEALVAAPGVTPAQFKAADLNKDGALSREEYADATEDWVNQ